jgi:hypothetical protein
MTGATTASGSGATTSAIANEGTTTVTFTTTDRVGNTATTVTTVVLDHTPPVLTGGGQSTTPTGNPALSFTISGNEAITCSTLTAADLTLTNAAFTSATQTNTTTCTVAIASTFTAGQAGTSSVALSGAFAVTDTAGNAATTATGFPMTWTVDRQPPTVSVIALQTASDTGSSNSDGITSATTLVFDLIFSKSVTGVTAGDLSTSGTATGCIIGTPAGSGSTYTVTVTGCSAGTLALSFAANGATDVVGNTGPSSIAASATVTIDRTAPTLTGGGQSTSPTNTTALSFTIVGNETIDCSSLTSADLTLTNATFVSSTQTNGTTCTVSLTSTITSGSAGTSTAALSGAFGVTDTAGNAKATATGFPLTWTVDRQPPTVSIIGLQAASDTGTSNSDGITNATTLVFDLVFSEPVTGVTGANLSTSGTATGCIIGTPAGSGSTYTVTVTGCSEGTLILRFAAAGATDTAGNTGPASQAASATVTIDRTAPAAPSVTASGSGVYQTAANGVIWFRPAAASSVGLTGISTDTGGSGLASLTFGPAYAASVISTSGLVGYWRLGEASGVTAVDASGHGLDGTYLASPTLGSASLLANDSNTAMTGNGGGYAAGTAAHMNTPTLPAMNVFTTQMWVRGGANTSRHYDRLFSNPGDQFEVAHDAATGVIKYYVGAGWVNVSSLAVGETAMFTIVFDGTNLMVYKNGTLAYSAVDGRSLVSSVKSFGATPSGTEGVTDTIDEAAIFSRALTAGEIASLYAAGTTPGLGTGWTPAPALPNVDSSSPYTESLGFTGAAGNATLNVAATDLAGNGSGPTSLTLTADSTAPSAPTLTCSVPAACTGWSSAASTTVTASGASDAQSGLAASPYTWAMTGATTASGSGATTSAINAEGTTTVTFTATDNVGNVSTISSTTVKLDHTAPPTPTVTATTTASVYQASPNGVVWFRPAAAASISLSATSGYAAEVLAIPDLAGYWRLGETAGTVAAAAAGPAGTYVGAPTLGAAGLLTGDANKAMTLTAANQGVSTTAIVGTGTAPFTLTAWVRGAPLGGADRIMTSETWNVGGVRIYVSNTGGFYVTRSDEAGVTDGAGGSGGFLLDGATHFLVGSFDGSFLRTYYDGVQVGSTVASSRLVASRALSLGGLVNNNAYRGTIDEPAVFSRALSTGEIAALYAARADAASGLSGLSSIRYQNLNPATNWAPAPSLPNTVLAPAYSQSLGFTGTTGSATIDVIAHSGAGTDSTTRTVSLTADSTGPTGTSLALSAGSSGVPQNTASVTVTASGASDAGAGLAASPYTWAMTGATTASGSGATTSAIANEGTTTVTFTTTDRVGNTVTTVTTVVLDHTPPVLTGGGQSTSPTNTAALSFTISGNEPITCSTLTAADLTLTNATFVSSTQTNTTTCTVAITSTFTAGQAGTSSVALSGAFGVTDTAGNAATTATGFPMTWTVDLQPPTVSIIALQAASDSGTSSSDGITNATTLVFDLVFSEPVTGVTSANLSTSGTATGCIIGTPAGSGSTYTVTVTGCSEGTLILRFAANGATDTAGNTGPASQAASATVTIDRTAPTAPSVTASGSGVYQAAANGVIWFRPAAAGAAALTGTSSDAGSGLSSLTFGPAYVATVLATGPLSYWRLGEASGTTAADSKGTNPGTYIGSPTLGAPGALTGDSNTAATLNGTSQSMQVAGLPGFGTQMAVGSWFKTTVRGPGTRDIVGTPGPYSFSLHENPDGSIGYNLFTAAGSGFAGMNSALAYDNGGWHLAVGTFDGTNARLYVDGALVAGPTGIGGSTWNAAASAVDIGYLNSNFTYFAGTIDEPAIWSRALSAGEIATLYAAGTTPGLGTGWTPTPALPNVDSSSPYTENLAFTGLAQWDRSLVIEASDVAGNGGTPTTLALSVDTTAPSAPTLTCSVPAACTSVSNAGSVTVTASASTDLQSGLAASPYTWAMTGATTASGSGAVTSAISAEGTTTVTFTTTDRVGNVSAGTVATVNLDHTAPTLTGGGQSTSPTNTAALSFTIVGNEAITCSTLTAADLTLTNATFTSATQTNTTTCTVSLTSTIASGSAGTSSAALSGAFAVTDTAGNAATTATGFPMTWTVDRAAPPTPTVTATTTASVYQASPNGVIWFRPAAASTINLTATSGYAAQVLATANVSGYWRLGEASGTTAANANGSAGTYVGAPTLADTSLLAGDANGAVTLNGTSQWVDLGGGAAALGDGDWSMSAIIKPSSVAAGWHVIFGGDTGAAGFGLTGNTLRVSHLSYADAPNATGFTAVVGTVYAVTATYIKSSGLLTYYVNGAFVSSHIWTQTWTTGTKTSQIGRHNIFSADGGFAGTIDEAATFTRALSAAEVGSLYNAETDAASGLSGLASIRYQNLNPATNWAPVPALPNTVLAPAYSQSLGFSGATGSATIDVIAHSGAGTDSTTRTVTLTADSTAPTGTSLALSAGSSGVPQNTASVTVTASGASDAGAGLAASPYTWAMTGATTSSGSGAITSAISVEGTTTVTFTTTDRVGNSTTTVTTVVLDHTPPVLTGGGQSTTPTGNPALSFTITGNEPITCSTITAADLTLTNAAFVSSTGASSVCTVTITSTVAVNTIGTSSVALSGAFGVTDTAGNNATTASGFPMTWSVDRTNPQVTTIALQSGSDSGSSSSDNLTNAASPVFDLVFNKSVSGVTVGDLSRTGTATGCIIGTPAGSGSTYTVVVTGCSAGTLALSFAANGATDVVGNTGPSSTATSAIVTIDRTAPTLTGGGQSASPTNTTALSFTIVGNETIDCSSLTSADLTLTNATFASSTGATTTCTVSIASTVASGSVGTSSVALSGAFGVTDPAGNNAATATGFPMTWTVDLQPPSVTIIGLQAASDTGASSSDGITNAASPIFDLVFSEPVTGVTSADFSNGGTATGCTFTPAGSGSTYTVTVAACSEGSLILRFAAAGATDTAGNTGPASQAASATITIDRTAPTGSVTSTGSLGSNGWYTGPATLTIVSSDARSGVASVTYSLDGGSSHAYVAPVTVSADGSHTLAYTVTDIAGNVTNNTHVFTIDGSAPLIISVVSSGTLGNAGWYRSEVQVTLVPIDTTSGVASAYYSLDGGASTSWASGSILISGDGSHSLTYFATDNAGNVSGTGSRTIKIDTSSPSVTGITVNGSSINQTTHNQLVTLQVGGSDPTGGSGIIGGQARVSTNGGLTWATSLSTDDGLTFTDYPGGWFPLGSNGAGTVTAMISGSGIGQYQLVAQVADVAGNLSSVGGTSLNLQNPIVLPTVIAQAVVWDCRDTDQTHRYATNGGTIYWPVEVPMCLVPTLKATAPGLNGINNWTASLVSPSLGAWNGTSNYVLGDVVSFNGSSYAALQPGVGHSPAVAPTFWSAPITQVGSGASSYTLLPNPNDPAAMVTWSATGTKSYPSNGILGSESSPFRFDFGRETSVAAGSVQSIAVPFSIAGDLVWKDASGAVQLIQHNFTFSVTLQVIVKNSGTVAQP